MAVDYDDLLNEIQPWLHAGQMIRQQVGAVESGQDHTYGGCSIHFVVVIAKAGIFIADGRMQSERQDSATVARVCLLLVFLLHRPSPLAAMSLLSRRMSPDRFAGLAVGDPPCLRILLCYAAALLILAACDRPSAIARR